MDHIDGPVGEPPDIGIHDNSECPASGDREASAKQAAYQRQYRTRYLGYRRERAADFKKVG